MVAGRVRVTMTGREVAGELVEDTVPKICHTAR
jgi:hypothetical protein